MNSGSNDPEAAGGPAQGGGGLTSRGGYSYITGGAGMMIGGQNQAGPWAAYTTGFMEGEDKPWWFPWEVDGGGGGALRSQDDNGIQRGLITGGTGSLGNALTKRLLETKIKQIRIFSRNELKQIEMESKFKGDDRLCVLPPNHSRNMSVYILYPRRRFR